MSACRRCSAEIFQRFVGATPIWTHGNRKDLDHPAVPVMVRKVAPLTESEKRLMDGNR